jgi:poly [ADP-ribose] polymerase
MASVVEEHKLILADIKVNANKFWHGKLLDDNTVLTEWGRVGESGQSLSKSFPSPTAAQKFLATKRREKERKGYSVQRTLGANPTRVAVTTSMIESDKNPTTKKLMDFLVKENVHQITANTKITFDVGSGSFATPLGVVTDDGIDEAEELLKKISSYVEKGSFSSASFSNLINGYMRIIPSNIGRSRPDPKDIYPNIAAVQAQQQILDALRASLAALDTSAAASASTDCRARLTLLEDDKGENSKTFKKILKMYLGSKNDAHVAAKLRLRRVYEIELLGMNAAFEKDGAKLTNIWELWHGTRAANLLSILNSGYVIPRSGGSIAVTGRMYGDGVYFSDQSTKSLNYSYGYWGGGKSERTFMLLNDVAMGKFYTPDRAFGGSCKKGYDSTYAKAGRSGVRNNEMIVYRTSQIRPKFLCEFG